MAAENNIENNDANAKSGGGNNVSTINIEVAPMPPAPTTAAPMLGPMTMLPMPTSMPMSMTVTIPSMNSVASTEEAAVTGTAKAELAATEEAAAAAEIAAAEAATAESVEAAAAAAAVATAEAAAAAVATAEAAAAAVASAITAAAAAAGAAAETVEIKTTKTMNLNANLQSNGENNGNVAPQMMNVEAGVTAAAATAIPEQQQQQFQQETQTESHKGKMDRDSVLANFKVLYVLTQLCGLTMVLLVGSWVGVHMGGLAGTNDPKHEFNWHPLLMTIGLIFLYGNSILVYRGFRTARKKTLKISHASIHMTAFILTVIALKTVFDSHNLNSPPIPNMYSLHSWLGLTAVLLFCLQYVAGFMSYMVPGLKENYKIAYMPFHIYFGLFGFVLAIASALMGLTEKAIFSIDKYSELPSSGVTANMCGMMLVIFAGLVVYLATEPAYKRKPIPEDAVLLTGANE